MFAPDQVLEGGPNEGASARQYALGSPRARSQRKVIPYPIVEVFDRDQELSNLCIGEVQSALLFSTVSCPRKAGRARCPDTSRSSNRAAAGVVQRPRAWLRCDRGP